jgi:diguanylate cyclase (GGDEF)-like protein
LQRLEKRFNQEGQQEYLEPPVAHIAAVNFSNISEWTLSRVMGIIYSVIEKRKTSTRGEFHIFDADLIPDVENLNTSTIDMIEKLAQVGGLLDQSLEMAFTDSVSGLPNLNAASRYLNRLQQSMEGAGSPFSIFIIDGDNLGQYNKISYQQGDYMIKKLGETLKKAVRPNDFIARWRSGDEFFVVLPDVGPEEALVIGERFREAVKTESQDWQFPVTISIGVASYPVDGGTIDELIDQGELALRMAKQRGKNCVSTASQG